MFYLEVHSNAMIPMTIRGSGNGRLLKRTDVCLDTHYKATTPLASKTIFVLTVITIYFLYVVVMIR